MGMSYIKEFELYLQSKGKSDNTVSGYVRDTKAFMEWYQSKNDCSIEKIIELDTVEYKKYLQRTNQAIITVNRKIASINAFLKWMRYKGYIGGDIAVTRVKDKDTKQYKGLEDKDLWKLGMKSTDQAI
jgi:site-specific recombinase XerD